MTSGEDQVERRASAAALALRDAVTAEATTTTAVAPAPKPSSSRLAATLDDAPLDVTNLTAAAQAKDKTVFYLAYGSNLSDEKFRGSRGIKPLSAINVQVPELRLTFDLPALPYSEPCMANTARRDPHNDPPRHDASNEKQPLLSQDYRKNRWHKGLVGVVWEVTLADYAHIIATEGGGSSYQDVLVDCHPFASDDPSVPVPQNPTTPSFKAHTLFAPALPPDAPQAGGGAVQRPDPSYAQPSARYLKLLTDGAAERKLPMEYQDYLHSIRPYHITTVRQRVGQVLYAAVWVPAILAMFGLGRVLADKEGRIPGWLKKVHSFVFRSAWRSYDVFYKRVFGDGERTIGDTKDSSAERTRRGWWWRKAERDVEKSSS